LQERLVRSHQSLVIMFEIYDNFLSEEEFLKIKNSILNSEFSWNLTPNVSNLQENLKITASYYFTHLFESYEIFDVLLEKLNPEKIIRIKANLYPSTEQIEKHSNHIDYEYQNIGAIYYLNTNNGMTILEDTVEVKSIKNRLLIFDGSKLHCSTTCSDDKCRVNVNLNFI
jgi:hypothetical protein